MVSWLAAGIFLENFAKAPIKHPQFVDVSHFHETGAGGSALTTEPGGDDRIGFREPELLGISASNRQRNT
jgi:hypothetical protein